MKKFILCSLLCYSSLQAEWKDEWEIGLNHCRIRNYAEAEPILTRLISDTDKAEENPKIYLDRGKLYRAMDRKAEALNDIEKALTYTLTKKQTLEALQEKLTLKADLNLLFNEESSMRMLDCSDLDLEEQADCIIIKNPADNEMLKILLCIFYINSDYCQSVKDFTVLENGDWMIKKTVKS